MVAADDGAVRSLTLASTRNDLLAQLRKNPTVMTACRAVNVPYQTLVKHRISDPEFAEAITDARLEGWERLEAATFDEAMRPSEQGFSSARLKEFLLKGRKRHVYGDRLSVESEHRHEVRINLVPVLPAAATATAGEVIDAELVEVDPAPESEES